MSRWRIIISGTDSSFNDKYRQRSWYDRNRILGTILSVRAALNSQIALRGIA